MSYIAPVKDMLFNIEHLARIDQIAQIPGFEDAGLETAQAVLEECAKLNESVIAPLNWEGDKNPSSFKDGVVTTTPGFKEAYRQYAEGGWQGLQHPVDFGGQGLPKIIGAACGEILQAANMSFALCPLLTDGAIEALLTAGSDELKAIYLEKLVSGQWTGTMNLTEPQAGSDLAAVRTRAEPQPDGTYKVFGTKIFITYGEHDMAENIIHLVLARVVGAPEGVKGISLFVVPKFKVKVDGTLGERNAVNCGSIEHKMGIRASSTAVLNFDDAEGFMVFEPNRGLEAMFTFMNTARLGTAVQGVCHAEAAFQGALPYAKDRRSMRALSGKKDPENKADALIWHPDVRRMLLTQKAIAEGGRAMIYDALKIGDHLFNASAAGDAESYKSFDSKLGFYTPILKGFLTEMGLEAANLGVQVFGGHGYIKEHGMEQIVRDARISTLYEGTTGIQALDLLGRKVLLGSKGKCVRDFTLDMVKFVRPYLLKRTPLGAMARNLAARAAEWNVLTTAIMLRAPKDRELVGAASVDYLMYCGFVMMGYYWAVQAAKAEELLASGVGKESEDFYRSKIQTAEFYFERLMPRANAHRTGALAPTKAVMQLDKEHFAFA